MQFIVILAGAQFRPKETREFLLTLSPGFTDLHLERDPSNPYDSNAVRVVAKEILLSDDAPVEHFIGFVPKVNNFDISLLLKARDGEPADAIEAGLISPGHVPQIERIEILDFVSAPLKPTIIIEISTGWEVGTLVQGEDADGDGEGDFLPDEDDEDSNE